MEVIEDRGEATILIGDMNRAVGEGKWGVKGNKTNISYGGKLLRDLLETEEYILLNNLDIVEGGPWTWVSRANQGVRSCLDLAVISRNLLPFVSKVIVDREQRFTPYRVIKRRTGITSYHSDHFSFKVILSGMPSARCGVKQKETTWNLSKPGAWEAYENKTKEAAEKLEEIINQKYATIEQVMDKIESMEIR